MLTRATQAAAIEAELAQRPLARLTPIYFDLPRWLQGRQRGRSGEHLYYYLWQAAIYPVARRLHRRVAFDIIHHVTFVKYWVPSFVCLMPAPFVWGPVGGGESTPRQLLEAMTLRGRAFESARSIARAVASFDPFVRLTARRSRVALATTAETATRLRRLRARRVEVCSQVGLSCEDFDALGARQPRPDRPFTVISLGQLLHLKGFDLGLEAFARSGVDGQYVVVGDGPERERLRLLADQLGIADRVQFTGYVQRPEALRILQNADVLVHPTLHDSGGWAPLEAMAAGKPVICLDAGGSAEQVVPDCGVLVPPATPSVTVSRLTDAIQRLAADPTLRDRMGAAGQARVRDHYLWPAKIDHIEHLYTTILEGSGNDDTRAERGFGWPLPPKNIRRGARQPSVSSWSTRPR
ncbi:MAG: glycosyltransferase family 4 protein [Egibacteraceae bacterium]